MGACCSSVSSVGVGGSGSGHHHSGTGATPLKLRGSTNTNTNTNGVTPKKKTPEKKKTTQQNNLNNPTWDDIASVSTRSKKNTSGRDGLLTPNTTARSKDYQPSQLTLTPAGSPSLTDDEVIMTIPFFDSLDMKHIKILRSFFTRRVYAPKEVVLAEGLPLGQQVFHIIISGRVEMCAKDAYGKRAVLQQFGPGQWFGECTWNYNQDQIQPVTVYALERTTILYTSSHQFAAALQQFPQLSVAINVMNPDGDGLTGLFPTEDQITNGGTDTKHTNDSGPRSLGIGAPIQIQLKNIPFFADIDELKLQQLAMLCEIRKRKAGTWICLQGADADGFYYIIKGRVEVSAHGFMDAEQLMSSGGGDELYGGGAAVTHGRNGRSASTPQKRGSGDRSPYCRPDDSPGATVPRIPLVGRVGAVSLHPPLTPLTGLTPSPPSTPSQRPYPHTHANMQSRKSLNSGKRGGSFSASVKDGGGDSPYRTANAHEPYDEYAPQLPPPESTAYLDTLKAGDWFGEIALIEQTTRTASVQAIQDCILLYLSRERFIRFLKFAPAIESSTIFSELIMKRTANSLKCLPIFAPLKLKTVGSYHQFDEKRLALLGAMFQYLSVPAGTNIFNEGDFGMAFYIVIQGVCIVTAKSADGDSEVFLNELRCNDYFGESSLLHHVRCNATVKTKTQCLLLKLSGEDFQKFLQVAPEVEDLFRQRVNMRTSERLKRIPFFKNVRENKPWSKLDLLGALFTFEEFSMNEIVFQQGTIGTKFYIIVSGEIEISVAKEKGSGETQQSRQVLEVLTHNNLHSNYSTVHHAGGSNGGWFGEIALMRNTARTATARCISSNGAVLLSIDSSKFQKFLTIAPELSEDFTSLLIHRTSNLLKSFDLFKQVQENKPWSKMEMLASLFQYELFEPGQAIYTLHASADKFYVIASGTVRLESVWSGVQTMHSQSVFGAMELMKNIQSEKAYKKEKIQYQRQLDERNTLPDRGASLSPLTPPEPTPPVLRTHSATALELCGLMTMSVASFKSLLTIAPEIIPYFTAIAEHDHRRASQIGNEAERMIESMAAIREKERERDRERDRSTCVPRIHTQKPSSTSTAVAHPDSTPSFVLPSASTPSGSDDHLHPPHDSPFDPLASLSASSRDPDKPTLHTPSDTESPYPATRVYQHRTRPGPYERRRQNEMDNAESPMPNIHPIVSGRRASAPQPNTNPFRVDRADIAGVGVVDGRTDPLAPAAPPSIDSSKLHPSPPANPPVQPPSPLSPLADRADVDEAEIDRQGARLQAKLAVSARTMNTYDLTDLGVTQRHIQPPRPVIRAAQPEWSVPDLPLRKPNPTASKTSISPLLASPTSLSTMRRAADRESPARLSAASTRPMPAHAHGQHARSTHAAAAPTHTPMPTPPMPSVTVRRHTPNIHQRPFPQAPTTQQATSTPKSTFVPPPRMVDESVRAATVGVASPSPSPSSTLDAADDEQAGKAWLLASHNAFAMPMHTAMSHTLPPPPTAPPHPTPVAALSVASHSTPDPPSAAAATVPSLTATLPLTHTTPAVDTATPAVAPLPTPTPIAMATATAPKTSTNASVDTDTRETKMVELAPTSDLPLDSFFPFPAPTRADAPTESIAMTKPTIRKRIHVLKRI